MEVEASHHTRLENDGKILCGDFRSMALILGFTPIEVWTNATVNPEAHEYLIQRTVIQGSILSDIKRDVASNFRPRLRWKNLSQRMNTDSEAVSMPKIYVDPGDLSTLLHKTYNKMFMSEGPLPFMSQTRLANAKGRHDSHYTRAGFAILLQYLQSRVATDWEDILDDLIGDIQNDMSMASPTACHFPELVVFLHICGTHVEGLLDRTQPSGDLSALPLALRFDPPVVVYVTIQVPSESMRFFAGDAAGCDVPPTICAQVSSGANLWSNTFSAIQTCFGSVTFCDPTLQIHEETSCRAKNAPLVVPFYVPTEILVVEGRLTSVSCALHNTPMNRKNFTSNLGPDLRIFQANFDDREHVFVTEYMPHMDAFPKFAGYQALPKPLPNPTHGTTMFAGFTDGKVDDLATRLHIHDEGWRKSLVDQDSIDFIFLTPLTAQIAVGTSWSCTLPFFLLAGTSIQDATIDTAEDHSCIDFVVPF